VPHVSRLSIAPVKGLALVHPEEVFVAPEGVAENRRFFLLEESGEWVGARKDGRLLTIRPAYATDPEWLSLGFPDGSEVAGEVRLGDAVATDMWGVELTGRVVEGPWADALSRFLGRPVRLVRADRPGVDRDFGPVTLVSEASLAELARRSGANGAVDGRRFRMLVGVDGCAAHEEDGWCGRRIAIGEAVVRVLEPVARCVLTTVNPATGVRDLDTLREIKDYRGLREGKNIDFGVVGDVVRPGRVRVGDPVEPLA
jgi:uncharacterized protein YcbX